MERYAESVRQIATNVPMQTFVRYVKPAITNTKIISAIASVTQPWDIFYLIMVLFVSPVHLKTVDNAHKTIARCVCTNIH